MSKAIIINGKLVSKPSGSDYEDVRSELASHIFAITDQEQLKEIFADLLEQKFGRKRIIEAAKRSKQVDMFVNGSSYSYEDLFAILPAQPHQPVNNLDND